MPRPERLSLFRALALVAGAFLLLVHAAGAQSVDPATVVDAYERAWSQQDLDAALDQLADNAIISLNEASSRSLTGRAQIRDFLELSPQRSTPVLTSPRRVHGETITWSERTADPLLGASEVTIQATVHLGQIQSLVYQPGRLIQPAAGQPAHASPESAATALVALVLLGLGLLSLAGAHDRTSSSSQLRGRLIAELRQWRGRPGVCWS